MQSVRSRAIELAADPRNFETAEPLRETFTPAEAKLEADAHLAVCIDGLVARLTSSEPRRQKFMRKFNAGMLKVYLPGTPNSEIGVGVGVDAFQTAFFESYASLREIDRVFATNFGQRTIAAGLRYREYASSLSMSSDTGRRMQSYIDPKVLLLAGINTMGGRLGNQIVDGSRSDLSPKDLQERLVADASKIRSLSSVSFDQFRFAHDVAVKKYGEIQTIETRLARCRSNPVHLKPKDAEYAPHSGCPAMPVLPETDRLEGGSGVAKLYLHGVDLIVATNLHALKEDSDEFRIMPPVAETAHQAVA